jgi:F-type H+-transporting ATPase subunit b
MFSNPQFWVGLSFVILCVAAFKPVGKILITALDQRSAKIQKELGEALRLREEAQELLLSYQQKQKEAVLEAKHILENAEAESKRIIAEAEKNLEENLNNKIQASMHRIANFENSVMMEIRANAIDVAIDAVRVLIKENLKNDTSEQLITTAIDDMKTRLH